MLLHPFETVLSVTDSIIEWELRGTPSLAWADFWLNPRRLRGSDFLMRWSQGAWSEERFREAIDATQDFFALPYGPFSVAPDDDVRAFELYFERLEAANLAKLKRPDLLIFPAKARTTIHKFVNSIGGLTELPFLPEFV